MRVGSNATPGVLRWTLLFCLAPQMIHGQERAVSFDPLETGKLTGEGYTILLLAAFVAYALVRVFFWFIESRRLSIPWQALRRIVPLGTLLLAWIIFLASSVLSEALVGIFLVLNLPAVAVGGALVSLLHSAPRWQQAVVGSLGWWLGWYGAIRFAEWKAWSNVPVYLKIDTERVRTPLHPAAARAQQHFPSDVIR